MPKTTFKIAGMLIGLALAPSSRGQDATLPFNTTDAGITRSITNWGLDTTWTSSDNMQRGLIFMGTNNVNVVRVGFVANSPLTNNDISPAQKATLQSMINVAAMASSSARWDLSSATGAGVDPWYQSGSGTVYPDRWAAAVEACQRYYNKKMWMVETFNEPDYGWGQGSKQNLSDAIGYLQASTNFPGAIMAGGSTLNCDTANAWYAAISNRATMGTTHCLAGSVSSYVGFLQNVSTAGGIPFHPEAHNVMETLMGANYGLQGVIWWGTAELTRGSFVKACQGQRLAYAENWPKWSAAAVYRGTNGAVQAFLGASERMGLTTSYRFFCKDRNVFYNGNGPQRDYTVSITTNCEQLVNITWGADAPPAIGGRYIIVNRFSGKVLEVPSANTNWGVTLDQNAYSGASNQQWNVAPLPASYGGDLSYYTFTDALTGSTADESNWSYNDGNAIIEYGTGVNAVEHWYFEYAGNGYFYIRNRWSGKYLDVSGPSTASGASIVQYRNMNRTSQQWRLLPVGAAVEFVAPAAPTSVTAAANAVSIQLNWRTNSESDLAGYTVLRATNSGGPYEICARGLTNNTFTDQEANQVQPYFYVIQAVDRSVNTSVNSAPVSATPTGSPAPVAVYHFDGNANDSSGNANHAAISGPQTYVAGVAGSALNFDGASNFVNLPATLLNYTNFTMAAWVWWNGGAAWQRIFDFGNDTTQYLFLTPNSGSGTLRFGITTNGSGAEQRIETAAPLASNRWIHVAVTCNGSTGCLYTNGVLAASSAITLNPASFRPALNYLGHSQFADPLFAGRLDEVQVANYALTSAQMAWLPVNSAPPPTLAHRYSFNETGGTIVHDTVMGGAGDGALPNGGTFGGGQLALAAASAQYVSLPAGILGNATAVTLEAWVTFPDQIAWNTMFFAFGNTNGSDGNNYLSCSPQGGRIAITSTNYTGEQSASCGMDFSYHTNFHLTAVFNPPQNCLQLYTNGVLAGVNTAVTSPLSAVGNLCSYLGRSLYSGDTYFDCSLDELRIYNGAMSAADVAAAQLAGPEVVLATNVLLTPTPSGGRLALAWPQAGSGFTLASSPSLGADAVWTPVLPAPSLLGTNDQVLVPLTNAPRFFRLQR